jgi:hypothetical protein
MGIEKIFPMINGRTTAFLAGELVGVFCRDDPKQKFKQPYFYSFLNSNDIITQSLIKLDNIFKNLLSEPNTKYERLLKTDKRNQQFVKFFLPYVVVSAPSTRFPILQNNRGESAIEIANNLRHLHKYKCRIVFRIAFSKITENETIYPKMHIEFMKCDEIVSHR